MSKVEKSILPWDDDHFEQFNLKRDQIEQWEDGMRTDPNQPGYEWWYFDTHMDDNTQIVVTFQTKLLIAANGPLNPFCTIEITTPDGKKTEQQLHAPAADSHFSKSCCDVRIGTCWARGDLTNYQVHVEGNGIVANLSLHGTVPSWRPGISGILWGDDEQDTFFWLPAVPAGDVEATVTIDGKTKTYQGNCYHDHNWGNISLDKIMHHWYWGRASIGPFMVISSWMTGEKKYGYPEFSVFMLTRDGKLLTGNEDNSLRFFAQDKRIDPVTHKPYSARLIYEWDSPEGLIYRITYQREKDIAYLILVNQLPTLKKWGAKLLGIDPTYIRFTGPASVDVLRGNVVIEHYEAPAIWEAMHLGKAMPGKFER